MKWLRGSNATLTYFKLVLHFCTPLSPPPQQKKKKKKNAIKPLVKALVSRTHDDVDIIRNNVKRFECRFYPQGKFLLVQVNNFNFIFYVK